MFGCALCVYVSPATRGGGIAEVKAFLNGVKISGNECNVTFKNFTLFRTSQFKSWLG